MPAKQVFAALLISLVPAPREPFRRPLSIRGISLSGEEVYYPLARFHSRSTRAAWNSISRESHCSMRFR